MRARLADRPAAAPPQLGERPPRCVRRVRWLPVALVPVGAAAAVAIVVALVSGVDEARLGPSPATAAEVLERAAARAEHTGFDVLAHGEVLYVRDSSAYLSTFGDDPPFSLVAPTVRETWAGRDGRRGFVERAAGKIRFPGPRDRARWIAAGRPGSGRGTGAGLPPAAGAYGGPSGFWFGRERLRYEELRALPTDPKALYRRLLRAAGDAGPTPDVEAFEIIGDLLRTSPVPRRVRAALYRAAARIRGIRLVGEVRDPLGRPALAIELAHADSRRQLLFDPKTSAIIGEQQVLTKSQAYIDAAPGYPIGWRVVEQAVVVTAPGKRPQGRPRVELGRRPRAPRPSTTTPPAPPPTVP